MECSGWLSVFLASAYECTRSSGARWGPSYGSFTVLREQANVVSVIINKSRQSTEERHNR
jgi:hypothetical protein